MRKDQVFIEHIRYILGSHAVKMNPEAADFGSVQREIDELNGGSEEDGFFYSFIFFTAFLWVPIFLAVFYFAGKYLSALPSDLTYAAFGFGVLASLVLVCFGVIYRRVAHGLRYMTVLHEELLHLKHPDL